MNCQFVLPHDIQQAGERIEDIGHRATRFSSALDNGGRIHWRIWGSGPALVLFHGGFGSWRHWARNIDPLARHFRVIAVDTPGLGDSDAPDGAVSPAGIGRQLVPGLQELVGNSAFDVAAFSFGGVVAGATLLHFPGQVRSLTLCGASGMGLRRRRFLLVRRTDEMSERERFDATRENLKRLMLRRHDVIDPAALYIHHTNDNLARLRSRRMSMGDSLAGALRPLADSGTRLNGIWGEFDVTAIPWIVDRAAVLKQHCPAAQFASIADAGHWVSFEKHELFNTVLMDYINAA